MTRSSGSCSWCEGVRDSFDNSLGASGTSHCIFGPVPEEQSLLSTALIELVVLGPESLQQPNPRAAILIQLER